MEGFVHTENGVVYGVVDEVGKEFIKINILGKKKPYNLRIEDISDINKGDKIRAIVKNNSVVHIEKLGDEEYSLLLNFFRKIKEITKV